MQEELGLFENPISEQVKKIIEKGTGKTVYFRDFIDEIAKNSEDIIDVEIIEETIINKVKNKEL